MSTFRRERQSEERGRRVIQAVLGEQDGPTERELKSKLQSLFRGMPDVEQAFLVLLIYRDSPGQEVALAIGGSVKEETRVVESVQRLFAAMFSQGQHLDVIFLSPRDYLSMQEVVQPFYRRVPGP